MPESEHTPGRGVIERTGVWDWPSFHAIDRERDARRTLCGRPFRQSYDCDELEKIDCKTCRKQLARGEQSR